jgi:hypothetical protein
VTDNQFIAAPALNIDSESRCQLWRRFVHGATRGKAETVTGSNDVNGFTKTSNEKQKESDRERERERTYRDGGRFMNDDQIIVQMHDAHRFS